jgi:hydrogenase/urease accessory protein HupE
MNHANHRKLKRSNFSMKRLQTGIIATLVMFSSVTPVMAHPGHGSSSDHTGPMHYLTEPVHVVVIIGSLLIGLGMIYLARKALDSRRTSAAAKFH